MSIRVAIIGCPDFSSWSSSFYPYLLSGKWWIYQWWLFGFPCILCFIEQFALDAFLRWTLHPFLNWSFLFIWFIWPQTASTWFTKLGHFCPQMSLLRVHRTFLSTQVFCLDIDGRGFPSKSSQLSLHFCSLLDTGDTSELWWITACTLCKYVDLISSVSKFKIPQDMQPQSWTSTSHPSRV